MIYRQGDIMLIPIKKIPANTKKKNLVLAEGEVTGHCHQFLDTVNVAVMELDAQQFAEIRNDSWLVHEEHDNLLVEKGLYEVRRQRELNLLNEFRRVED